MGQGGSHHAPHSVRIAWNSAAVRRHCRNAKVPLYTCLAQDRIKERSLTLEETWWRRETGAPYTEAYQDGDSSDENTDLESGDDGEMSSEEGD